jgi:hypothetical protein
MFLKEPFSIQPNFVFRVVKNIFLPVSIWAVFHFWSTSATGWITIPQIITAEPVFDKLQFLEYLIWWYRNVISTLALYAMSMSKRLFLIFGMPLSATFIYFSNVIASFAYTIR